MLKHYAPGLAILLISAPVVAQDVPMIDGVGAWSHSQVMRHRRATDGDRVTASDRGRTGQERLMALSPESRQALIALKPELDRRTRVEGQAAANRWFDSKVADAERREGLRP